jgi:Tfp pilus assembly protein PilF
MSTTHHISLSLGMVFVSTACMTAPPVGLLDVASRPAERALWQGLSAYDNAQYPEAEKNLQTAISTGLTSAKDLASAHKHLAFIYCSTKRISECETAFVAARNADRAFALSRSEQGHPAWGPVYRRLLAP